MRTKFSLFYLLLWLANSSFGQQFQGTVHENYEITVQKMEHERALPRGGENTPPLLEGFPIGFKADANTKNFRNVTLADINQDGVEEILFAAANRLYVYQNNDLLWKKNMIGTGIYPPSVADIDNDGDLEIVQVTGGNLQKGRVYVLDHEGNAVSGFPKNYDDNWILTTAALADLDGDAQLEIIFLERNSPGGNVHVLRNTGESWSSNFPVYLPRTPAVTPSVADIDNDGQKEIVVATTVALYSLNLKGQVEEGFPIDNPDTKFSFQSPILADLDDDKDLEIIGAAHGNKPEYYIFQHDGTPYKVWPFIIPENEWSFTTPTLVEIDNQLQILMSRPRKKAAADMLYAWNEAGDLLPNFPIDNESGLEGVISVADIDNDTEMELIFGSNRIDEAGFGYIYAFNMDGSGLVDGFPIRPYGWTLLNGAAIGDVNQDGRMDLTALTYTTNFGAKPDSIFLNVYDLGTPYTAENILWNTYKGNNRRDGNLSENLVASLDYSMLEGVEVIIQPNPITTSGTIQLQTEKALELTGQLFDVNGRLVHDLFHETVSKGKTIIGLPALEDGFYIFSLQSADRKQLVRKIIVQKK